MSTPRNKLVTVKIKNGDHLIYMPDGQQIPGLVFTRVMSEFNKTPYVIAKLFCNIGDKEEVKGILVDHGGQLVKHDYNKEKA